MKAERLLVVLEELFPNACCELNHKNAYELTIAVVLSAQTTDASVNRVTPKLFETFPDVYALASADLKEIEHLISSLGLYRNKAKSIQGLAQTVVENFNGEIPNTMSDLMTLPGVGRKCGNVILAECFQIPALAVDTHLERISKRLRLAKPNDSVLQVEMKLRRKIPKDRWIKSHHQMIFFGRYFCKARNPECFRCPFVTECREVNKNLSKKESI